MRYVFIINPAAGVNDQYVQFVPQIEEFFRDKEEDYKVIFSANQGDAKAKAKAEAETGDDIMIFSCGGEGTCFEILNGVIDYDNVTIAVIPIGSANDFLKCFGIENKSKFMSIEDTINGTTINMDIIKADEFYCLNGCSVGMDAVVARDKAIFKNWPFITGPAAYKLAIVKNFFGKIGMEIELTIDGIKRKKEKLLFATLGNGPAYGGGYLAVPDALPNDGILDYAVVKNISKLKILGFLKLYQQGKHQNLDFCDLGKCSKMEFVSEKPIPVNLDGEIVERKTMSFEILKEKIKFRLPSSLNCEKIIKNTVKA